MDIEVSVVATVLVAIYFRPLWRRVLRKRVSSTQMCAVPDLQHFAPLTVLVMKLSSKECSSQVNTFK